MPAGRSAASPAAVDSSTTPARPARATEDRARVLSRIQEAAQARPDLAPMLVAVATVVTRTPLADLLAVLNTARPEKARGVLAPGRMLFDPGHDDTDSADVLAAQPAPPVTQSPSMALLGKLVKLMRLAGLDPNQVATFIRASYGVSGVQQLIDNDLAALLDRYRVMGPTDGPAMFRTDVLAAA